ncbi:hypothetical protein BDN67DRAFT_1017441 [Paxillus ammoniavirescens]|nr:hypothetical protein BDN67DRAFT_1017441 [Paxillus ammoniavirescens]
MLSSILKPTAPIDTVEAEKMATKDAFVATTAKVHAVAMSRPGDSEGLEDERRMWMQEWSAVTKVGIKTTIPPTVLQEMNLANEAFKKMQDAVVGPTAPLSNEPPRASSPFPSILLQAIGRSKMEVMINKGKGRKWSHQDLTQEEMGPVIPKGMTLHVIQCAKCEASKMPCIRPARMSCQKCMTLKHKYMYTSRGKPGGGGSAAQPPRPTAVNVGPSTWAWAPTVSNKEEEEGLEIVVKAGPKEVKGKGKGRAILLSVQESDKLMKLRFYLSSQ